MPAYNHGQFLEAAIKSALWQTSADIEVVVCDNCSTDNTRQIVSAIAAIDSRVRYEPAAEHVSMVDNFNRCWGVARGRYVKFLCADDILEPSCVERLLVAMEASNAVLAGCARYLVPDPPGGCIRVAAYAKSDWSGPGEEAARHCFFMGNVIGEPTAVLLRREAPARFNARYSQLMDLDLWLRLLEHGKFAFVAEPLCRIRMHAAQATRESAAEGRISADKRQLFHDYASRPHLRGTLRQRLLWDFRMAWSRQREPDSPQDNFDDALFYPKLWSAMRAGAAVAWRMRSN
jgi:glycosyltransferase involved in cell wall biosynthesis